MCRNGQLLKTANVLAILFALILAAPKAEAAHLTHPRALIFGRSVVGGGSELVVRIAQDSGGGKAQWYDLPSQVHRGEAQNIKMLPQTNPVFGDHESVSPIDPVVLQVAFMSSSRQDLSQLVILTPTNEMMLLSLNGSLKFPEAIFSLASDQRGWALLLRSTASTSVLVTRQGDGPLEVLSQRDVSVGGGEVWRHQLDFAQSLPAEKWKNALGFRDRLAFSEAALIPGYDGYLRAATDLRTTINGLDSSAVIPPEMASTVYELGDNYFLRCYDNGAVSIYRDRGAEVVKEIFVMRGRGPWPTDRPELPFNYKSAGPAVRLMSGERGLIQSDQVVIQYPGGARWRFHYRSSNPKALEISPVPDKGDGTLEAGNCHFF